MKTADGDIVVTARRRVERAQDVPIALSVLSGETIDRTGYSNLVQIAELIPSLVIRNNNARNTFVNIRGLGSNANQSDGLEVGVGFYVDDVYYGRIGATQFDLIDLDQVEVLRGPQGTLFGKNTTAGAISITTRLPSFTRELRVEAGGGERGYRLLRASVTGPILDDKVAARLTVSDTHNDGWLYNVARKRRINDFSNWSVRGQLLVTPSADLNIRLIGDFSKQDAYSRIASTVGIFTGFANGAPLTNSFSDRAARAGYAIPYDAADPFSRIVDVDAAVQANMEGYGLSGKIDWRLGGVTLTSVAALRWWDWYPLNDQDNTSLDVNRAGGTTNRQRQFSQELRLASNGSGSFDYVAGLYYFWQVVHGLGQYQTGADYAAWNSPSVNRALANLAYDGFQSDSIIEPHTKSYAAFGQATWHVTDALSLTEGLRFTHEDKVGVFDQHTVSGNDLSTLSPTDRRTAQGLRDAIYPAIYYRTALKDDALTGQVSLAYRLAPEIMTYASYARGSKSGGLGLGQLPAGISPVVRPETIDAFEAGVKSQFFDRRVTANIAAYLTEVADYQSTIIEFIGTTTSTIRYISSIPGVRSKGVEVDLAFAPSRLVRLAASTSYNDAVYRGYTNAPNAPDRRNLSDVQDLSGAQLSNAPKFIYSLSADVARPVRLFDRDDQVYARADFVHRSSNDTSDANSRYTRITPYGVLNARVGVRRSDAGFDVSVWARNLTDERYFTALSAANTGLITGNLGDPQQFGGTVRISF